ncbi:MAG TPA: fructose-6-phosphate aldolase [Alphaproteobacteria bacterium]|jgi:transaldolase|nr:fructose-6-phosphate aldolase [Alphaproteobacteria bacterium]HAM48002.1 fructose-6-phosphate aldolase [Alphaproteobacteria bacterium]HBA42060.1 fructose-6-phosphate aldolase [Alphaproteobacteria bacterium]HBF98777.1 fructose-6-phosphate aldolase [Alphaproteobacteria bacterium]HCO43764.1 fructose-6-phosphate aldolase [Gammaproteobacteria bacterium]
MKFFVDTADLDEIRDLAATGMVDGVTTNPSLVAKAGRDFFEALQEICDLVPGPVSAEVTATDTDGMLREAEKLRAVADNIAIKVPTTWDGLKACRRLADEGVMVNVTLCFSVNQAILAAKAGAAFVSPFVGRLDDIGQIGMDLIADIKQVYDHYPAFKTEILVASVRHVTHLLDAARLGADICTIPPNVLRQLIRHPLTDAGLAAFLADWEKTGQKIVKD